MAVTKHSKTIQIGMNAFAVRAQRGDNGTLKFCVDDLDSAFYDPNDAIAERFKSALKRRLEIVRQERASNRR